MESMEWIGAGSNSYIVPNNPGAAGSSDHKPVTFKDFLPVPAEVAPVQTQVLNATNAIRAEIGRDPLELDTLLCKAAMVRATEMALAENLSHTRPKGNQWSAVVTNFSSRMGENVVMPGSCPIETVGEVSVALWRDSHGHYTNMTNEAFNCIGVGFARSESGRWYGCQLFAYVVPSFGLVTIDNVQLLNPYYPPGVTGQPAPTVTPTPSPIPTVTVQPAPTATTTAAISPVPSATVR